MTTDSMQTTAAAAEEVQEVTATAACCSAAMFLPRKCGVMTASNIGYDAMLQCRMPLCEDDAVTTH